MGQTIMNENYIVINGKKIELTEEQLKMLGIDPKEKRKNPFERVTCDDDYYYVTHSGNVDCYTEVGDDLDQCLYDRANYFNDEAFANQVALHQLLYRKLLKFAYENGLEDIAQWNGVNKHWLIYYDYDNSSFISSFSCFKKSNGVWFSSEKGAEQAIAEVVGPFMKEHPEFVW